MVVTLTEMGNVGKQVWGEVKVFIVHLLTFRCLQTEMASRQMCVSLLRRGLQPGNVGASVVTRGIKNHKNEQYKLVKEEKRR